MNYYQHHIGDYRRDTSHLSLLEHGVYRQLLDMYYLSEEKIPDLTESVFRRLCARTKDEQEAVITILNEFFVLEDDGWSHKRCDLEIQAYKDKAERARHNGKAGGRPKKTESVPSGLQDETKAKANHKPLTNNQEPIKKTLGVFTPEFEQAWAIYPKRAGGDSKKEAFKAWSARVTSGVSTDDLIAGVKRYAEFVRATGREGTEYVKQARTFFGPGDHYAGAYPLPVATAQRSAMNRIGVDDEHPPGFGHGS